jgi:voltage-gated sodium channel
MPVIQPQPKISFTEKLVKQASEIVDKKIFTAIIFTLILVNAALLGLETYPKVDQQLGHLFHYADMILLWIFTLEIILKLMAAHPTRSFFKDPWNLFDFFIVLGGHIFVGAHFVTVLRILRVLRVLRAISIIPSLKRIVNALLLTIPSLGNIFLLMSILFYIFAVIGTVLFGRVEPEYFGSLHLTLLTLFQVVTLESWASGVMRPVMAQVPYAWIYFVSFILLGTFVIFNLFIGVIVSNVEKAETDEAVASEAQVTSTSSEKTATLATEELRLLRQEVSELRHLLLKMQKEK